FVSVVERRFSRPQVPRRPRELPLSLDGDVANGIAELLHYPHLYRLLLKALRWPLKRGLLNAFAPDVLVLDSLNTVPRSDARELSKRFLKLKRSGPKIIILVLDAAAAGDTAEFWEYVSDIVIRLDWRYVS